MYMKLTVLHNIIIQCRVVHVQKWMSESWPLCRIMSFLQTGFPSGSLGYGPFYLVR